VGQAAISFRVRFGFLAWAIVEYYFTEPMNLRLREREFEFSSAKDVQDLSSGGLDSCSRDGWKHLRMDAGGARGCRLRRDITVEYMVAVQKVEQAFAHDLFNARLQNFATSCRAWLLFKNAGSYNPQQIAADLKDAAARSSNMRILRNLHSWYETMLSHKSMKPQDSSAVQRELQSFRKIIAAARQAARHVG
jgi:hypothetical protein